ncbi:MAG: NAD(P)H-dependent oxidoreductase [Betaproteobacteria bacterium]|nr:NAD(P)H-dependent oxidoreductase [Betaproteobacteria bacterium]
MHILGISGSLRQGSLNTAALRSCAALLPDGVTFSLADLAAVPLYNEDLRVQGLPLSVQQLREQIKAADAIVIATPEYNYSFPGVLKNAIDWASRPPEQPFDGKPIALIGATPGGLGTSRAQYQLRQVFIYLNGHVLNRPEVMISAAPSKFDADGKLVDETTTENLRKLLTALCDVAYQRKS